MAYYRDSLNPDAMHFPARLATVGLFGLMAIAIVATASVVWLMGAGMGRVWQLAALAGCLWILAVAWPKHILTDPAGVHAGRVFKFRRRFIAWRDITSVRVRREVWIAPRMERGVVGNWAIEVTGGGTTIRFTCRHSGRDAFLHQLKRWASIELQR